jgi:hypothetical protein
VENDPLPRLQQAQPLAQSGFGRGQDQRDPGEVGPARTVEVVGVLVVREQHGVDRSRPVLGERRPAVLTSLRSPIG